MTNCFLLENINIELLTKPLDYFASGSPTDIANQLLSVIDYDIVAAQGKLWIYDQNNGYYGEIHPITINKIVCALEGTIFFGGVLKVTPSLCKNVYSTIYNLKHENNFFENAPAGVAIIEGFVTFNDENKIELVDHSPTHKQRSHLPISFIRTNECSIWDNYLHQTFNNSQISDLINEVLGCILFGIGHEHHKTFIFYGNGGNGKSVLLNVFRAFLPAELSSAINVCDWRTDYHRLGLLKSRLNACGEFSGLNKSNVNIFKQITGGDSVMVRPVGGNAFSFICRALHVFTTNTLEGLPEVNEALRRRLLVIPFDNVVPEEKRNPHIADKLIAEGRNNIFSRALEGAERVRLNGFTIPESVAQITNRWFSQSNPALLFAEGCLSKTTDRSKKISAQDMIEACSQFCMGINLVPPSIRQLAATLESLGFEKGKSSVMIWYGVEFK